MNFDFTWRELVRRRPGMYIGPSNQHGLVALISDLIDQTILDFRDPPYNASASHSRGAA